MCVCENFMDSHNVGSINLALHSLILIMSENPSKKPRLAAAAEALIEAASMETDAMTQKRLIESLDSLKASFDNNLNKTVQKMQSSNENFDAKINTLSQHVIGLKSEMEEVKKLLEEEKKQKTLERALGMTDIKSFQYYDGSDYGNNKDSSNLAKETIQWFLLDYGINLPDGRMKRDIYNESEKEPSKQAFRDKFKEQIKVLIMREPRVTVNNGVYAIYYQ